MLLEIDQLSTEWCITQYRNTKNVNDPVIPNHSKAMARLFPGLEKHLLTFTHKQPHGRAHQRPWSQSCRAIAPSHHFRNTNCLKAPDRRQGHSLELCVHGFGNKSHYLKVECRVCLGLSTQELLKWLHSSVFRKYSLTKRAVPNCYILVRRYSVVYMRVEWHTEIKRQRPHLFPVKQRPLLDTEHFGKYGKASGPKVWFLGSWSLGNQTLRLQTITFVIHHQNC